MTRRLSTPGLSSTTAAPPPGRSGALRLAAFLDAVDQEEWARGQGLPGFWRELTDAAWRELCSERRAPRCHDTNVIAETPSEQGIPRSARETTTRMS